MGDVSNTDYPVLWQLKYSWNTHQPHHRLLILNEWGRNFEFEFCKNIEDKLNGSIPCITITYFVVIHACPRRSQVILTFNRHRTMYSVFCIAPCIEVACEGLFFIHQHSNEQGQALQALISDHSHIILDLCFISECTIIILILFP